MSSLSQESRALLDANRGVGDPSEAQAARVRAAIASRIGAMAPPPAAPSSPPPALAATTLTPLLSKISLSIAVVGAIAALLPTRVDAPLLATSGLTAPVQRLAISAPAIAASSAAAPEPAPAPRPVEIAVAKERARLVATPRMSPAPAPSTPKGTDIAAELAALRAAQATMREGHASEAAATLDAFAAAHPGGALSEEREGAAAIARCTADPLPTAASRAAAERFVHAHPGSPLAARVGAACSRDR